MTEAQAALTKFIAAELARPVPPAVSTFASELAARGGRGVVGVLFYGSALRTGASDGLLDFYVLLDRLESWDATPLKRAGARALPPNVEYAETTSAGMTLRSKLAVMTLDQFRDHARAKSLDTTIWARFAQPAALVFARDTAAGEAVADAVAGAARGAAWWAAHLGPEQGSSAAFWSALFGRTYESELRVEGASRPGSIVDAAPQRYDAVLRLAWAVEGIAFDMEVEALSFTSPLRGEVDAAQAAAGEGARGFPESARPPHPALRADLSPPGRGEEHRPDHRSIRLLAPKISKAERADAKRAWKTRARLAKPLNMARLAKAAFTFSGGVDYIAWKIERHSGHKIDVTPFQRRHPLLSAGPALWRLWRKGVLR